MSATTETAIRRPADAVLRISEDAALAAADVSSAQAGTADVDEGTVAAPSGDEPMLINMGPQHPSTHGVLRIAMELQGETVLRSKPIIGYLHTGMEKTAEDLTYLQGPTNVTRMDYVSPLFNELVFCLAVEDLLGTEIPPRATWIRMLMCELNRMSSHLLFLATHGMDLGAVGMMLYGWREREEILRFFRERHRLANEPQLHPPWRCGGRPARWLAGRCGAHLGGAARTALGVRHVDDRPADLARPHSRRRRHHCRRGHRHVGHGAAAAQYRRGVGSAPHHAVLGLRRGGVRRRRRCLRRHVRPLFDPPERESASRCASSSSASTRCRRVPTAPEDRKITPPPRSGSHQRVHGSADPPLQDLHRGLQGAAR